MTPLRIAVGRVVPEIVFAVGAVGFFVAFSALVTAAGGLAPAWAASPPSSGCSLYMCVGEALNNVFGIPGSVFGAVAAVVTAIVVGPGAVLPLPPVSSPGEDVTTFIPGVSPLPSEGDLVYIPGQGASRVTEVYRDYHGTDDKPGIVVKTELGTIEIMVETQR